MSWLIGLVLLLLSIVFFIPFAVYKPTMTFIIFIVIIVGSVVGGIMSAKQKENK